jgi:8-oxo-dGTP pyrophosphatase MutT (NUDIX family)
MSLSFDQDRAPTPPKDAATVLVLRDGVAGVEVYCVQRHAKSPFLGGAIVFPGGKVDPTDEALGDDVAVGVPAQPSVWSEGLSLRALAITAARELLEEAGLVPSDVPTSVAHALQDRLREKVAFDAALRDAGARLELARLVPFGRWVTPAAEARRFDARFFLMRAERGQEPRPDERETTLGFWAAPRVVLERFHGGDLQLAPPTTRCLEILLGARTSSDAIALASAQTLRSTCPLFVPGDPPFLALPGDPAHPEREPTTHGPTRFVLRDARFVSEDPPA